MSDPTPLDGNSSPTPAPAGTANPQAAAAQTPAETWAPMLQFTGKGLDYFVILLGNSILSVLTLGVYHFWGVVKRRNYLWSSTKVMGEPLEYTGTGKELFISFLIVAPILAVFLFLFGVLTRMHEVFGQLLGMVIMIPLWQYASYRALRYRLTRTRWRGIRGNLVGSPEKYALKATGWTLLIMVSFGLLGPYAINRIAHLQLNNVFFGNRRVAFAGKASTLYPAYLLLLLSSVALMILFPLVLFKSSGRPTEGDFIFIILAMYAGFGLIYLVCGSFWHAAHMRWLFGGLVLENTRTRSTLTGWTVLGVRAVNALLLIVSLGWAFAWVHIRELRMSLNTVDYTGDPDLAGLMQDDKYAPKRGEGLLEALDLDIAF